MDLFSLLAKLTLDKTEYDKGLEDAEKQAKGLDIAQPVIPKPKTSEFESGVKEAENTGSVFSEVMTGVWEGLKESLTTIGLTSIVAGFVNYMKQGISLAIKSGKEIKDNANNLGISTKAYQEYEYVLGQSNLKVKDLTKALKNYDDLKSNSLTKERTKQLAELGITAENTATQEQFLANTIKALANYTEDDKGAIVNWLFGDNQNWDGFFRQTAGDIEGLKQQANDIGFIMSDESIENADAFTKATNELSTTLQSINRSFGESIVPLLTDAVNAVKTIVVFFSGGKKGLAEIFAGTDKELAKNLTAIEGTSGAALDLVDKLFAMGDAEKLTAEQQAEWKQTAEWLINNIPSLSKVIDTDTMSINGNKDAITANIDEWKRLEKQRAISEAKAAKESAMMAQNADAIDKVATARAKGYSALEKQNERIAEANRLLTDNEGLASIFGGAFGTTTIESGAENLQQMLDWITNVGYEFADTKNLEDITNEYNKLTNEQAALAKEAEEAQKQLDQAEKDYEQWSKAIDEMFGAEEATAIAAKDSVDQVTQALYNVPSDVYSVIHIETDRGFTKAIGDHYIPYDNFPALLHRGERVLTATEARKESKGADFSGLEDKIVASIRAGMEGVTVNSYLNGRSVTEQVNRETLRQVKGRRFAR